ncbi:MAG: hypothetical protein SGJ19_18220 [Planctomycetia bacterium]|nr:hypothetical protein [Planctomycetia bacterium]
MLPWICLIALCAEVGTNVLNWSTAPFDSATLPPSMGASLTADELRDLEAASPTTPYDHLTCGVRAPDGTLWVGSPHGLMLLSPQAERWSLFHSPRWLPSDEVRGLSLARAAPDGSCRVIVDTAAGAAALTATSTTLDAKMEEVQANLRRWHVRHGLVAEIRLEKPGDVAAGYVQPSSDNDGLWTSMYVAGEAFRYGATKSEDAKRNARQSLEALMFQERITKIPGFVARSFVPIDDDPKKYGGEWHRSSDGKWWWKGDTSSDELDGHYFAYAVYYDLVADEQEREEIRGYVSRITDHILDHGYYYVGPPGTPTTWGVWAPEKLNHDLEWIDDRGLNSLEMLSHLKVAEYMTGAPRYTAALKHLIERESYEMNTVLQKITWPLHHVNHSDDELAFLAYYPLLMYERDPALRKVYLASLERSWRIERPETSPLLNYIYAAGRQASHWPKPQERPAEAHLDAAEYDRDACLAWFHDVPVDTICYSMTNSNRRDVALRPYESRGDRKLSVEALPTSERRVMKWNGDPFELDGGSGGLERDDGAFILLPYWMGVYHRFHE